MSVLALTVLVNAEDASTRQERAAEYPYRSVGPQYNQDTVSPSVYKTLQTVLAKSGPSLQQQDYVSQQSASTGLSQAQQYYEQSEPQAVAYAQPSVNKYVSAAAATPESGAATDVQKVSPVFVTND